MLNIYLLIIAVLTLVYVLIVLRYWEGWRSLPYFEPPANVEPTTTISVIISARNEAKNIAQTLHAVLAQNYPKDKFDLILIDDHSTDNTAQIAQQIAQQDTRLTLLALSDFIDENTSYSFKKKAIEIGVQTSKHQLIVCTDADCVMGENWLRTIAHFYEKKQPKFIAAPVVFQDEKNTFQRFQSLDFIGMMGVNGAGIFRNFQQLCNGANLAYEREVFFAVNGFEGIDELASGDDMMLLQKIAQRYPSDIAFLKNTAAITRTTPKRNLRDFVSQRIRWATKTTAYPDPKVTLTWALIWLFCVSILFSFCASIFFGKILLFAAFAQLFVKASVDYIFLRSVCIGLNRKDLVRMSVYLPSIFMEWMYVVLIGLLGLFVKKYTWKGRAVK